MECILDVVAAIQYLESQDTTLWRWLAIPGAV